MRWALFLGAKCRFRRFFSHSLTLYYTCFSLVSLLVLPMWPWKVMMLRTASKKRRKTSFLFFAQFRVFCSYYFSGSLVARVRRARNCLDFLLVNFLFSPLLSEVVFAEKDFFAAILLHHIHSQLRGSSALPRISLAGDTNFRSDRDIFSHHIVRWTAHHSNVVN